MSLRPPKIEALEMIPPGMYHAICYAVTDLGTQPSLDGKSSHHDILLWFELPDARKKNGQRQTTLRTLPLSAGLNPDSKRKSVYWQFAEALLNCELSSEELSDKIEPREFIGCNCMLEMMLNRNGDKTFVATALPLAKTKTAAEPLNAPGYIELTKENFDEGLFNALPGYWRAKIEDSPEYRAIQGLPEKAPAPVEDQRDLLMPVQDNRAVREIINDDIPF